MTSTSYFSALGVPEWHGCNLDAVWDSLKRGDINERNPVRFRIVGTTQMARDARETVSRFENLIKEARRPSVSVDIELLA